ncbi:MAG: M23 family metallopeptidase [Candidatus Omnitrophota bacterium]
MLRSVEGLPKSETLHGKYHKIIKGQTLWQISRLYSLPLETLIKVNNISETESIKEGQLLFIPEDSRPADIAPAGPAGVRLPAAEEDFCWPLKGRVLSSFGQYYRGMLNKGVNIQSPQDYPVLAARSGKVIFSSSGFYGYGKVLIISHGEGLATVYGRNSELLVKKGDYIRKGAVIARVGRAGRDKSSYLHFEIRKGQIAQNPYFYLPG